MRWKNRVIQGNNVEILSQLPEDLFDMVFTSPPYDNLREYKGIPEFSYTDLGKEIYRTLKPGGVCCWVQQDGTIEGRKTCSSFRTCLDFVDNAGLNLWETVIYSRLGAPGYKDRFRLSHEYIFIFMKGNKPKTFNEEALRAEPNLNRKAQSFTRRYPDGNFKVHTYVGAKMKKLTTVMQYNASSKDSRKEKLAHPATFPDELAKDFIQLFSNPDELVLDPFNGSGTTCYMAKKLGRQYTGIEYAKEYVELSERLLKSCQTGLL